MPYEPFNFDQQFPSVEVKALFERTLAERLQRDGDEAYEKRWAKKKPGFWARLRGLIRANRH